MFNKLMGMSYTFDQLQIAYRTIDRRNKLHSFEKMLRNNIKIKKQNKKNMNIFGGRDSCI